MKKSIIVFSLIAIFVTSLIAVTPKTTKSNKAVAKTEVKASSDCAKTDAVKPCNEKKEAGCTAKVEGDKKDCAKKCSEGATASTDKKCCSEATASADKKCCKEATATTDKKCTKEETATADKKCCKGETVATTK
ncbi:MAG TPA: hypothetical protein P5084_00195 [Paludibacter sp.]|nr:hypothetical protein [Paludibacter sp.]